MISDGVLETKVLVSRCLKDKKFLGLGLDKKVLRIARLFVNHSC